MLYRTDKKIYARHWQIVKGDSTIQLKINTHFGRFGAYIQMHIKFTFY